MAFSTTYKAIRDQLSTDCATVFSVASTAIYYGTPGLEVTGNHVTITARELASSFDHPAATGKMPGMTVEIEVEAFLTYPTSGTVTEDAAFVYADALCAVVEAGATYAGVGMLPILSRFELGELTGIQEGNGNAQLHLVFGLTFIVQRDRG